jgi:dipeptidyl aminopeptidase/acylaminoacyl peptidase
MPTDCAPFEIAYDDEPTRVLRGVVERPAGAADEPLPWVLVLHGFKGFMDWGFFPLLSRGIAESGMVSVRFNTSGSGVGADFVDFSDLAAFEKDTYGRQLEDIERVRALVVSGALTTVDPGRAGLLGHSRGGGLGLLHAAEHAYAAIVTWAAIDDVQRFDAATLERWRADGHLDIPNLRTGQTMRLGLDCLHEYEADPARFDILAACARVQAPTLVVHGTKDESVPHDAAVRLRAALASATLLSMEGTGHTFGATHPLTEVSRPLERVLSHSLEHLACYLE